MHLQPLLPQLRPWPDFHPLLPAEMQPWGDTSLRGAGRIQIGYVRSVGRLLPPKHWVWLDWGAYSLKGYHCTRIAFPGVPRLALKLRHFGNTDNWGGSC